jgi:hypothetical protein
MNSACLCSLAGRYDNPIPIRFLAPIDCLKIPALADRKVDEQVGVGDGDMGALTQLDSDRARLSSGHKQAVRDIVQFIRKYQGKL